MFDDQGESNENETENNSTATNAILAVSIVFGVILTALVISYVMLRKQRSKNVKPNQVTNIYIFEAIMCGSI